MCVCPAVGSSTPAERAAQQLANLIAASPGNATFVQDYTLLHAVLCNSRHHASTLVGKATMLNTRLANADLFSLDEKMSAGGAAKQQARHRTRQRFHDTYPTLCMHIWLPNVRVWICFHAAPSEDVAKSILRGGFAQLQKLDAGYFGKGIYMTLDAKYAVEEYGVGAYGLAEVRQFHRRGCCPSCPFAT